MLFVDIYYGGNMDVKAGKGDACVGEERLQHSYGGLAIVFPAAILVLESSKNL